MMSEMEVKPGYKQTEVGVIPEDWEISHLNNKVILISGQHILSSNYSDKEEGTPYLTGPADFIENYAVITKWTKKPKAMSKIFDILITVKGSGAGKVFQLNIYEASISRQLMAIRATEFDQLFLYYILQRLEKKLANKATGNLIPGLTRNDVLSLEISIPLKIDEQTAIASALSDVDALISGLDRLIEKKQAIKQAAMQELLTGKRRLPGFDSGKGYMETEVGEIPEDWEFKRIGDCIDLLTGYPFSSTGYTKSGIRLLRGSNIKRGNTDWSNDITQYWPSSNQELNKYLLRDGDLVIAMDGSLVGRSYALISSKDLPALLLQRVARIRSDKISVRYLTQFIGNDYFINYSDSVKTVTAIPHISSEDIRNFLIPIPQNFDEQTAIATVLSDMDTEISALETRRTKTISLKQGMMQELLTGRIRLV